MSIRRDRLQGALRVKGNAGILLLACFLLVAGAGPLRAETPAAPIEESATILLPANPLGSEHTYSPVAPCRTSVMGSPYIPMDSWMYPALSRLYSLGYLDTAFLGLRPWPRLSVIHMLEDTAALLEDAPEGRATDEAQETYDKLFEELNRDAEGPCFSHHGHTRVESTYEVARGISGTPLHDSYHIGETVINDYGRPYEGGFDNYTGASGYATKGPFTLYARGEFQYAPSAAGYSEALAASLSQRDNIPFSGFNLTQATIPTGPIDVKHDFRLMEAYVSAHGAGHEFSFGKQDAWLGPGAGRRVCVLQ